MCGIAGAHHFNESPVRREDLLRMNSLLAHRGPDDSGVFIDNHCGLAHTRLKIIDLTPAAAQPMSTSDKVLWVTYNGEIYNFQEIRSELEKLGHVFKSRSDTEVILNAYRQWGEECLSRFNGMFAFAIWNSQEKKLFIARDRLGVKPLYYYQDDARFVFASELKAILSFPQIDKTLNPEALSDFLSLNYVPSPQTPFKRIHALLPGHSLSIKKNTVQIRQYWDLDFTNPDTRSEKDLRDAVMELFLDGVKKRLISDVPLGAFLSGGIDSSAIVNAMHRLGHSPLKTFNVSFEEASYDESPFARLVAQKEGTDHHEVKCLPEHFIKLLNDISWHADNLTADFSMVPLYLVAQLARRHVTVSLSGDGGDELFGGYLVHSADLLAALLRPLSPIVKGASGAVLSLLKSSTAKQSFDYKLGKFARGVALDPARAHYTWRTIFDDQEKAALLIPEFQKRLVETAAARHFIDRFKNARAQSDMDRIFYSDYKLFLADSILTKVDTMTMAHSLEARQPLLDYRLVELACRIPHAAKVRLFSTKHIFKQALTGYVPASIINRPKEGFHVPLVEWFCGPLKPFLEDVLSDGNIRRLGIIDSKYAGKVKQQHYNRQSNNAFKLWGLLNLVLWHRHFVWQDVKN